MSQTQQMQQLVTLLEQLISGKDINQAQSKIQQYETQTGFAVALLQIFANSSIQPIIRQQAGIVLKNVINNHWDTSDHRFQEPLMDDNEKKSIKEKIIHHELLGNSDSKIRNTTALIISLLADYDYPERWNNLLEQLLSLLKKSLTNKHLPLLRGSMQCLSFFSEHVDQITLPAVLPALFPLLLQLVNHKEIPPDVRRHGMNIYLTLLSTVIDMKGTQTNLVKDLLNPSLSDWLHSMNEILKECNVALFDFQTVVIKSLHRLCKDHFIYVSLNQIKEILPNVWNLMKYTFFYWKYSCILDETDKKNLTNCPPSFQNDIKVLSNQENKSFDNEERNHSDNSNREDFMVNTMVRLLDMCYLFLSGLLDHKNEKWRRLLEDKLTDIVDMCIQLSMLTHEHLELFQTDAEEFICAELDMFRAGDLRSSMKNALGCFLSIKPANDSDKNSAYDSILTSAQRILKESGQSQCSYAWRLREAAIGAFEPLADDVVDISELASTQLKFPIEEFIPKILYKDIQSENIYLQNRALWCLSHFVPLMGVHHQCNLLQSPIIHKCFTTNNHLVVRFAAVKVYQALLTRNEKQGGLDEVLSKNILQMMPLLCELLQKLQTNTIKACLPCLGSMIAVNEKLSLQCMDKIVPLLIKVWHQHSAEETIAAKIRQVLQTFARNEIGIELLRKNILPMIYKIFEKQEEIPNQGVLADAIEMVIMLADPFGYQSEENTRSNSNAKLKPPPIPPLSDIFYTHILPGVIQVVYRCDDNDVMTSGCRCVATLIRLNPTRILTCTMSVTNQTNEKSSIPNGGIIPDILKMIEKVLHPNMTSTDSGILKVGTLLNELILKLGEHLNEKILCQLLMLVIQRLHMSYLSELKQHLLVVLLRLLLIHDKNVINFLLKHNNGRMMVPVFDKKQLQEKGMGRDQDHQNRKQLQIEIAPLPYVMNLWCDTHPDFMYPYYCKVSLAAMCKLLHTKMECLWNVITNGYEIHDIQAPRRTRSQGQVPFSKMALPVKLFQLIVETSTYNMFLPDGIGEANKDEIDEDEDYEEDEWEDSEGMDMEMEMNMEDGLENTYTSPIVSNKARSIRATHSEHKSHSKKFRKDNNNNHEEKKGINDEDEDEDEDDGEWIPTREELDQYREDQNDETADAILYGLGGYNAQEINACPEALNDPLYQIQVETYIKSFVQSLANNDPQTLKQLAKELNPVDQGTLKRLLS